MIGRVIVASESSPATISPSSHPYPSVTVHPLPLPQRPSSIPLEWHQILCCALYMLLFTEHVVLLSIRSPFRTRNALTILTMRPNGGATITTLELRKRSRVGLNPVMWNHVEAGESERTPFTIHVPSDIFSLAFWTKFQHISTHSSC